MKGVRQLASQVGVWEKSVPEGRVSANALGQKCAWHRQEILRRPVWLRLSEGGGEPEVRAARSWGHVLEGLWGPCP